MTAENILRVPIRVDGLYVDTETLNLGLPMADFSEAWCPDAQRTDPDDPKKASTCASGVIHTLRMPASSDANAERFLSQGYAPIKHDTRQGNHLVSWYRSPLLPGKSLAADITLPVRTSDEFVRYFSDVGMFDTTYAAAWELGRMLTLRSKKVSVSLFNWKRAYAQQSRQAGKKVSHLPFAPEYIVPTFPLIDVVLTRLTRRYCVTVLTSSKSSS